MKKIIDGLFGDRASPQNMSALARAVGVSPATLCGYKGNTEKLKNGSARTVARIAKFRRLSMEEKARLMDELAE